MIEAIKNRHSVRQYTDKKVSREQIEEILKAAMFAPSGNHRRPWEFVVVQDREVLQKLAATKQWAHFVARSSVTIVVVGDEKASHLWIEDCSIVAEHIWLQATALGLGCCWAHVRGSGGVEDQVKNILGIPESLRVLCMMAIGYPAERPEPHAEGEYEISKIHWEKF